MTTVSPPYVPLVSINHHSMRDVRERVRRHALAGPSQIGINPAVWEMVTRWGNDGIEDYRWLSGLDPASVARFVRNLRPNRDPRREALRKKWYAAIRRLVAVVPTPGQDYWLLIPGEHKPRDGAGVHVGVFVFTNAGYVFPSAFEYAAPTPLDTQHQRLYRPDHGTYELRGHVRHFTTALQALKDRYLMIAEANPSDSRL
jgi:hypothetical protein